MRQSSVDPAPGASTPQAPPPDGNGRPHEGGDRPAAGPPADGDPADGDSDGQQRDGRRTGRGGKRRILRWIAAIVAVLILAASGAGYLYYDYLNGKLRKGALDLGKNRMDRPEPNAVGQTPLNILLLGSDSRNTDENLKLGGAKGNVGRKPLADVQMLVHVSADRSNMSVVSIPRDTRVDIPECTDPDNGTVYPERAKAPINESIQSGGPGCAVATWKELTGIYVDHFMMVDFAGVVDMADAIGGVPVCVDQNIYSHDSQGHGSGLKLTKGTHSVKGVQALQWLRTRYGFEDNTDIGRARAQHMYMNSMVRELKAGTKLSDPNKLRKLAESAVRALTVDQGISSVGSLYDLANDLKRVPTARITMSTMPWVYGPVAGQVLPKEGDAEQLFSLIRNDIALDGKDKKQPKPKREPAPPPSMPQDELPVVVQNGTGSSHQGPVTGRAGIVSDRLVQLGFSKSSADGALESQAHTVITYPAEDQHGDALEVAKALGVPSDAVELSGDSEQLRVIVGEDWRVGADYRGASEDKNKAPESAEAINGDDKDACMKVNEGYTW